MSTLTRRDGAALLRLALKLDALVSGLNGAAYLAAAPPLGDLLGLPPALLRGVGAFLLVYGSAVWLVAVRLRPAAVWAVVALNALWVAGSLAVAARGWGSSTGTVWIVLQAIVVGGFAVLQLIGLRRLS
jgi:hypothetical protein